MTNDLFQKNLQCLSGMMTKEEIERAIRGLRKCREASYKSNVRAMNTLLLYCEGKTAQEAELGYVGEGNNKQGTMRIFGASLLRAEDYTGLCDLIPRIRWDWWLANGTIVRNGCCVGFGNSLESAYIRPVIVILSISGNLSPGDYFYINRERFRLLNEHLAILTSIMEADCEFSAYPGKVPENPALQFCLDGWYWKLIRENPDWYLNAARLF